MNYLLDTDTCIHFLNRNPTIISKITALSADDLAISCFNITELLYGAYNSTQIANNLARVHFIEDTIKVLNFDRESMENYAVIKSELKKQGKLIDDFDILIAAVTISNQLILVTCNEKHFERIPNLKIENWLS